jgi:hypothetical protein
MLATDNAAVITLGEQLHLSVTFYRRRYRDYAGRWNRAYEWYSDMARGLVV